MRISLKDLLLAKGWKPEWFNETETIARIDHRPGGAAFVPFFFRHRFFHRHRYLSIRELLGASGTRVSFPSALGQHYGFLGMIEGCRSYEQTSAEFPWEKTLLLDFPGYPISRLSPDAQYLYVLDEATGKKWKLWMPVLTWIRETTVDIPEGVEAT